MSSSLASAIIRRCCLKYSLDSYRHFSLQVAAPPMSEEKKSDAPDLPFSEGFAVSRQFWTLLILGGLLGGFIGLVSSGFMNFVHQIPTYYVTCSFNTDVECGKYYHGDVTWIGIIALSGFVVGVLRWASQIPDDLPGFYQEIVRAEGNSKWFVVMYLVVALSLGGGACLGPEQGVGVFGAGLAQLLIDRPLTSILTEEGDRRMFVLCGLAGAMGCLFPTPVLGTQMIFELGQPKFKPYMEAICLLFTCAVIAWAVYYALLPVTFLGITSPSFSLSQQYQKDFQEEHIVVGFIIGCISAFLGFLIIISLGILQRVFGVMKALLSFNSFLRQVVPTIIGGVVIGCVNWALPLSFGRGDIQTNYILQFGSNEKLVDLGLLLATGFARIFLLAVSNGCGFKGGLFFPIFSIGIIAGVVTYRLYSFLPLGLTVGCFMAALPISIVPMPFTMTGVIYFTFFFGDVETIPIAVASFTSYMILNGSGILKSMVTSRSAADKQPDLAVVSNDAIASFGKPIDSSA